MRLRLTRAARAWKIGVERVREAMIDAGTQKDTAVMTTFDPQDYTITADTDVVFEDIDLDTVEPPVTFHGEQLTEAGAAELAAESAREARHRNLVPGRK